MVFEGTNRPILKQVNFQMTSPCIRDRHHDLPRYRKSVASAVASAEGGAPGVRRPPCHRPTQCQTVGNATFSWSARLHHPTTAKPW
ncbi:MAG: hypothetical protein ACI9MB_000340 [Verrucomicrobiales bacterium]|jgi:hypothetical protein